MANFLNEKLWKKSYLLEFYQNGVLTEAFTFAVPPEQEEFNFPQRVNETKTFGGSVIDDYGNDTVKISLSGTTINQELKLIYRSTLGFVQKTGEDEIFYLRDLLKNFGKQEEIAKNKEIKLFDLSSTKNKSWQVYPQEFQIKRAASRPNTYSYTLSMIAAPEIQVKRSTIFDYSVILNNIQGFIDFMNEINSKLEWVLSFFEKGLNILYEIESDIKTLDEELNKYVSVLSGTFSEVSVYVDEIISIRSDLESMKIVNVLPDLINACDNLVIKVKELDTTMRGFKDDGETIPESTIADYGDNVSSDEVLDDVTKMIYELLAACVNSEALIKRSIISVQLLVIPSDSDSTDDSVLLSYGTKYHTVTNSDTWDSLSQQYYGTPDYARMLAFYNGSNDKELKVGTKVSIPILNSQENFAIDNEVYNNPDSIDNFGTDLKIDSDGDIAVHIDDFDSISGIQNMNQAIKNRLSTNLKARVRYTLYGIRSSVGDAASQSYVSQSIDETISQDPRVKQVDNIDWQGNGDGLSINLEYTLIDNNKNSFGGTVK